MKYLPDVRGLSFRLDCLHVARSLLFVVCLLAAIRPVQARPPRVLFDLPYTVENGYYVVVLGTPAGPRRFIFDTGASTTVIRESLRDELALKTQGTLSMGDFEGHRAQTPHVCLDSLRMGELLYRDLQAVVLPDSSLVFSCFGVEGIVGCSLLQNLAVRFPNADSTITVTDDIRALGPLDRKRSCAIFLSIGRPMLPVEFSSGNGIKTRNYVLFDTGSAGWLSYKYYPDRKNMIDGGIAAEVERTKGFPSNVGWTNRIRQRTIVRGRIPAVTIAGATVFDMPFHVTEGNRNVIGSAMLQWGQAVIDFRHKRFWFLPDADAALRVGRQTEKNIAPAMHNGRLIVGQVWDESLEGVVEPGDRIVKLGTISVEQVDVCAFLRGEIRPDKPEFTVERKGGTRVTIPYKKISR